MSSPSWVDGRIVMPGEPAVAADDASLTGGHGVFEAVKVLDGVPFALRRHLQRLAHSARRMGIELPSDDDLRAAVAELHAAVALVDPALAAAGTARITVTAGRTSLVAGTGATEPDPVVIVGWRPWIDRREPTDVVVSPWLRNERSAVAGVKCTSYGEAAVALADARRRGASEALFANTVGNLSEGTTCNVFVGFGDELLTPPPSAGILRGVTRDLLVEAGVGVEADVPMARLAEATEAFLVSTGREVQPIRSIDGRPLPACPGPLTRWARQVWVDRYSEVPEP